MPPSHPPTPRVSLTLNFLLALPPTQYEGHRLNEEVSEGEEGTVLSALCVVFPPPHLLECEGGGGLRITGHGPLSLMVMNTAPHALPELASPPPRFGLCVDMSPTYCTLAMFGLCVLETPVGEMCPVCCSPVFKVPTFDAFIVATVRLLRLN